MCRYIRARIIRVIMDRQIYVVMGKGGVSVIRDRRVFSDDHTQVIICRFLVDRGVYGKIIVGRGVIMQDNSWKGYWERILMCGGY